MKKTISLKFVLGSAILMCVLIGDHSVQNSNAQTQPVPQPGTDLISASASSASTANTLPPDIDPNSPLAQVISLVQAGVEQSVILNYINNSTGLFNLNADQIIYLNDLGVPAELINAMMQRDQQLEQMGVAPAQSVQPVAATEGTAQPTEVTVNYFYDTLAPYGTWVNVAGYGWCWRPTVVIYQTSWQPYGNNGHWVYTDYGWYWLSGYSWGWATFHYGRWFRIPNYGWCWWPDTVWAPSWVCWRYDNDYCGWAPLPPHAIYRPGVGLVYNGRAVTVGFQFNLGVGAFTFVRTRDFCDRDPWRHRIAAKEAEHIYTRTKNVHRFDFDQHNRTIVNPGIPVHNITAVTKQQIHPVAIRYETGGTVHHSQHEQFERSGRTLVVNRPHFVGSPTLSVQPRPTTPTRPGENRNNGQNASPMVHGNQNNPASIPSHNNQHSDANQNANQNFNRNVRQPQTPQIGQPVVPHAVTPPPTERNNTTVNPRQNSVTPNQNQTPRQNNADNKWLSPRRQQFEQESPRSFPQNSSQGNDRQFSTPPANRYSYPPVQQQPNQNYRRVPQNNNAQPAGHSEPQQHTVESHSTSRSSSSLEQHSDHHDQNDNRH